MCHLLVEIYFNCAILFTIKYGKILQRGTYFVHLWGTKLLLTEDKSVVPFFRFLKATIQNILANLYMPECLQLGEYLTIQAEFGGYHHSLV